MHEIKLIDKAHAGAHTDMEYSVPDAKRSFWTGRYPIEGRVRAWMCCECGRVALYGDRGIPSMSAMTVKSDGSRPANVTAGLLMEFEI
jgi:hypothetical protein